jgi:hypothetical protein
MNQYQNSIEQKFHSGFRWTLAGSIVTVFASRLPTIMERLHQLRNENYRFLKGESFMIYLSVVRILLITLLLIFGSQNFSPNVWAAETNGAECSHNLVLLKNKTLHDILQVTSTTATIKLFIERERPIWTFWSKFVAWCRNPTIFISEEFRREFFRYEFLRENGNVFPVVRDIILSGITQNYQFFENPIESMLQFEGIDISFEPIPISIDHEHSYLLR